MKAPAYFNCWLFALVLWLKAPRTTYLVVRISRHTIWPHVFFARSIDALEVEDYAPVKPLKGWRGFIAAPLFRGRVRRGLGEEQP